MDNAKEAPSYAVHLSPDGMPRLDARRLDTALLVPHDRIRWRYQHAATPCDWPHLLPLDANHHWLLGQAMHRIGGTALPETGLQAVGGLRRRVPAIDLGAPEYCRFASMSEFSTPFLLA